MQLGARHPVSSRDVVAGHSLGEYTALVVAGALELEDAVRLVRFRAQAMQDAVPVGAGSMAAILGLSDELVRQACNEASQGEVVEPVNFNAPLQVVIAGHRQAVERACDAAKRLGAKRAVALAVSAPFHSSLLQPASDRLRERLAQAAVGKPRIDLINNVDVAIESEPSRIVDALARQAASPGTLGRHDSKDVRRRRYACCRMRAGTSVIRSDEAHRAEPRKPGD